MNHRLTLIGLLAAMLVSTAAIAAGDLDNADKLYSASKWDEAIVAYGEVLPELKGQDRARVLSRLGYAHVRRRNLEEAVEAFTEAVNTPGAHPNDAGFAQVQKGVALSLMRKPEEAVKAFKEVANIKGAHPNSVAEAYISGSSQCLKADRVDDAIDLLEQVPQLEGAAAYFTPTAYTRIGSIRERAGEYDKAIEAYQKVMDAPGTTGHQRYYAKNYIAEIKLLKQGDIPFYINPYLVHVEQTTANFHWISQGIDTPGKVVFTAGDQRIEKTSEVFTIERGTICHKHTIELTGLTPRTRYEYVATLGGAESKGSFTTSAAETDTRPVSFVVTGDTQTEDDTHRSVAIPMSKENADFAIHVGDLTDRGSTWGKWRAEFFDPGNPYLQKMGVVPAVGNHDGGPFFPILFDQPTSKMYFTFTHGNTQVYVLDSYWNGTSRSGRKQQLAWLEENLKNSKATWKIVALHVPMVATRADLKWFGKDDFLPIMMDNGVDLVLSGHHPMYRKYVPVGLPGKNPVIHVTTGGGGPVGDPAPSPLLANGAGLVHHTHIFIDGNKLTLTSKRPNGAVIDKFELIKTNGRFQDEIMNKMVHPHLAKKLVHIYHEMLQERTNRLVVDIDETLEPGQPGRIVVDTDNLPRGSMDVSILPTGLELALQATEGSEWNLPLQYRRFTDRQMNYDVVPPKDLKIGAGTMNPPLWVDMNLRLDTRSFEPRTVMVELSPAAMAKLASGKGGLPAKWDFKTDPDDVGLTEGWHKPAHSTKDWGKLGVVGNWEKLLDREYDGIGWYRTDVDIEPVAEGDRIWLYFGAIDESVFVYVNGKKVGEQVFDQTVDDLAWQKPRRFDITEFVKAGKNTIAVRVQDIFGLGGIYQGAILKHKPVNHLPEDALTGDFAAWSNLQTTDKITVAHGLGQYVSEQAVNIRKPTADELVIERVFEFDNLDAGKYTFELRMRQLLLDLNASMPGSVSIELIEPATKTVLAKAHASADKNAGWRSVSSPVTISGKGHSTLQVRITMRNAGQYYLDELLLTRGE